MRRIVRETAAVIGIAALLFVVVSAVALSTYGSSKAALAALRGQALVVDSETKSFGQVSPGQPQSLVFQIQNVSMDPVRILGSRVTCSCTMPEAVPLTIGPGERKAFRVTVHHPGSDSKDFAQAVYLMTNVLGQPEIVLNVVGESVSDGKTDSALH